MRSARLRWSALLLPVALLIGGAAGGAPLRAQRPRSSCDGGDCEAMRDYMAELAKLRAEVNALVRQQAKLQATTPRRGEELDALQDQVRYATRKLARLQSRLSKDKDADSRAESNAQIAQLDAQLRQLAERQERLAQLTQQQGQFSQGFGRAPAVAQGRGQPVVVPGYLGVVYTSQGTQFVRNGAVIVNHPDYPVVESVEPGSPAERAGVVSGDTIIAYNRRDLRNRDISLTEILQPGTRLLVTVKRDGRVRTVPVLVADRSENPEIPEWNAGPTPAASTPPPVRIRVAPAPPVAQIAPLATTMPTGRSSLVLAGAEFMRMNDDLREFFDVRSGVLVYSVGARTMAAQAGLRGGDVVISVNDSKVNTPDDIERIIASGGSRTVRLGIVRKGREQTVSLRW